MEDKQKTEPKIVIISGPSGVGKSTLCGEMLKKVDAFLAVSVTTRIKSDSEINGKDYWFVSMEEFQERLRKDDFLEHAEVFGNFYGTPRDDVEKALAQGRTVILEIDVQGALQIKNTYPDAVMVFILPPSQADLATRMTGRARGEGSEVAKKRLNSASREIAAAWQHYDHLVINADMAQAVDELVQIIEGNGEKK